MKFRQKIGAGMLAALLVLVGVGVGIVGMLGKQSTTVVADETSTDTRMSSSEDVEEFVPTEFRIINGVEFPVNENGLTYGYHFDLDNDGTAETHGDLVQVYAHNGKLGYCYWDEFQSRNDTTGYTLEQVMAGENNHLIDVYDVDGVTKIGLFGDDALMAQLDDYVPDGSMEVNIIETSNGLEVAPEN